MHRRSPGIRLRADTRWQLARSPRPGAAHNADEVDEAAGSDLGSALKPLSFGSILLLVIQVGNMPTPEWMFCHVAPICIPCSPQRTRSRGPDYCRAASWWSFCWPRLRTSRSSRPSAWFWTGACAWAASCRSSGSAQRCAGICEVIDRARFAPWPRRRPGNCAARSFPISPASAMVSGAPLCTSPRAPGRSPGATREAGDPALADVPRRILTEVTANDLVLGAGDSARRLVRPRDLGNPVVDGDQAPGRYHPAGTDAAGRSATGRAGPSWPPEWPKRSGDPAETRHRRELAGASAGDRGWACAYGRRVGYGLRSPKSAWSVYHVCVSEPGFVVRAEDRPAWPRSCAGPNVASRSRSSRTAITLLTSCPRVSWTDCGRRSRYCLTPSWCVSCGRAWPMRAPDGCSPPGRSRLTWPARRAADQWVSLSGTRLRSLLRPGVGWASCRCLPRPRCMSTWPARWPQTRTGWVSR